MASRRLIIFSFLLIFMLLFIIRIDSTMIKSSGSVLNRLEIISQFQKASNGFDLRGCTLNSTDGPLLTNEAAFWIGFGFGQYVKSLQSKETLKTQSSNKISSSRPLRIGIGRDPRLSGIELSKWFCSGIHSYDETITTYDLGLCTTPSMYLACSEELLRPLDIILDPWPLDGTVSITASHLPSHWNGFKFFTPSHPSNIGEEGIASILDNICDSKWNDIVPKLSSKNHHKIIEFLPIYSQFLKHTIQKLIDSENTPNKFIKKDINQTNPLRGLKITVNAGNGAGGFLASTLSDLGADTSSSIHLGPDGRFPNHIPNPEDKVAISMTREQTIRSKSDIGICLDCDADRVGLIDGQSGTIVNRNYLVALVSKIALQESKLDGNMSHRKGTVVTDSATSNGITRYITNELGGSHLRYKKGYRYVIEKARSISDSVVAIECSGHGAWKENGWIDDGCYTAVKILAQLVKSRLQNQQQQNHRNSMIHAFGLMDIIGPYSDPMETNEFRLKIKAKETRDGISTVLFASQIIENIAQTTPSWSIEPVNYEGIRVNFQGHKGWVMIRSSLHEPIVSLHIESEEKGGIRYATNIIHEHFKDYSEWMDLSPLETYLNTLDE